MGKGLYEKHIFRGGTMADKIDQSAASRYHDAVLALTLQLQDETGFRVTSVNLDWTTYRIGDDGSHNKTITNMDIRTES